MPISLKRFVRPQPPRVGNPAGYSPLRYWLPWILLMAALAVGLNAYLDFRNRELDKRLEQINLEIQSSTSHNPGLIEFYFPRSENQLAI